MTNMIRSAAAAIGCSFVMLACGPDENTAFCGNHLCEAPAEDDVSCPDDCGCGNGILNVSEQCDASNLSGASCESIGFAGGVLSCDENCMLDTTGCTLPGRCGDGHLDSNEVCDDGNTTNGDGCAADCLSDESCGNGRLDGATNEQCDDGNKVAGDGCSPSCRLEYCGNNNLDPREVCDDGNTTSGDGCAADCLSDESCGNGVIDVAVGEGCDDENRVDGDGCQADCSLPSCGDGVLDASELCDDGNNVPGDGCSTGCMSDESCGNGVVDLTVGEECDDGNLIDADGCQSDCALPTCGDGIRDATEICDDGDRESGDGCRSDCLSDETCGNGLIDAAAGEECDDGNTLDHDGCSATCLWEESATCDDDRALWERPAFTVPPSNPLDSLAPPFTVEAWILKRSTTLFQGAIASRYQVPATGNHRFQMAQWDSGDISVQFFAAGDSFYSVNYIASAPVGVGWHHVAVSCTASACTVFFDGQPGSPASFSTGTIPAWSGNWSFGANPNLNEQLRVPLDEVRLSDSARYSSSFVPKRRFFADANTLGLWHLDETTGTLVPDEGGLNHHGVVASGAWGPSECGFCNDGVDQDSNGQTDCADPSCIYKSVCW